MSDLPLKLLLKLYQINSYTIFRLAWARLLQQKISWKCKIEAGASLTSNSKFRSCVNSTSRRCWNIHVENSLMLHQFLKSTSSYPRRFDVIALTWIRFSQSMKYWQTSDVEYTCRIEGKSTNMLPLEGIFLQKHRNH